jgi:tRNA G18 (ribose-2'-O)-methylase SpoU
VSPVEAIDDPRLDGYRHLTDGALRRAYESEHGLFVLEGARVVRRGVEAGWSVRSLLLVPAGLSALADVARQVEARGGDVFVADRAVLGAIAGFAVHRGVLALAERPAERSAPALIGASRLVVVVEGVNDHENLGSIFRNSAAFGAGAVLLDPRTCDPLYRRSVRVSMGHVLTLPFARLTPWPDSLSCLRDAGFAVVALDPASRRTVRDVAEQVGRLAGHPRLAVMVGAEGDGLTRGAIAAATFTAGIPMAGAVDSLNVATSLAVALHSFSSIDDAPLRAFPVGPGAFPGGLEPRGD